jgi:hypothetical protein
MMIHNARNKVPTHAPQAQGEGRYSSTNVYLSTALGSAVSFVFRDLQFRSQWPRYLLKWRLGGPQGQSGRLREDSNVLLPQGIELRFTMQVD